MRAGGDEACDMGHVDQQVRFDGMGNPCHAFEVDCAWIRRAAGDEQRRAHLAGPCLDLLVVEQAARPVHAVVMGVEPAPGEVRPGAVAQVTARGEIEAQNPVSGAQQHEEHRLVRLRARMRLHVGVGGAEEFLCALDGEALDDVDVFSAPVEAVSGITLQRLVADLVSERLAHRAAHDVLRGDELDLDALAPRLVVERLAHRRIGLGEGARCVDRGFVAIVQGASHPVPFSPLGRNSARPVSRVSRGFTGIRSPAPDGEGSDGAPGGGPLTRGMAHRGRHGPGSLVLVGSGISLDTFMRTGSPRQHRTDHGGAPGAARQSTSASRSGRPCVEVSTGSMDFV